MSRSIAALLVAGLLAGCSGAGVPSATSPLPNGGQPMSAGEAGPAVADGATSVDRATSPDGVVKAAAGDSHFTVSGRYIDLNGAHFFVKGVDYWPTPIGTKPWDAPGLNDALRNGNSAIWKRDLPHIRAAGINAIRVYNVVPPPYDEGTGPISDFLEAAWNHGDHPIYVLMTIHFAGEKLLDKGAVNALANQYRDLDRKYAKFPAVLGTTISNEIIGEAYRNNATWWTAFNTVAKAAKEGFAQGGDADKLVMTADYDTTDSIGIRAAVTHNAAVDAFGVNVFRGRTFTTLFNEIQSVTTKPVLLTEYGAPASYHPDLKNTYAWTSDGVGTCSPTTPEGVLNQHADQLPESGDPRMAGLIDYATNNAKSLYNGWSTQTGVVSGGFYLEWSDEWWKARGGNPSEHLGDPTFTGHFPGCTYDEGWFGLNGIAKGTGFEDVLTPRPTLHALKEVWSHEG